MLNDLYPDGFDLEGKGRVNYLSHARRPMSSRKGDKGRNPLNVGMAGQDLAVRCLHYRRETNFELDCIPTGLYG